MLMNKISTWIQCAPRGIEMFISCFWMKPKIATNGFATCCENGAWSFSVFLSTIALLQDVFLVLIAHQLGLAAVAIQTYTNLHEHFTVQKFRMAFLCNNYLLIMSSEYCHLPITWIHKISSYTIQPSVNVRRSLQGITYPTCLAIYK